MDKGTKYLVDSKQTETDNFVHVKVSVLSVCIRHVTYTLSLGNLLMTDMIKSVVGPQYNVYKFVYHCVYSFSSIEDPLGHLVCMVMNNRTLEAYLEIFNEGLSVM